MIKLHVWITFPNGDNHPLGQLLIEGPDARSYFNGEFRYHTSYLSHPDAFAIDPVTMPLAVDATREIVTTNPWTGIHGVFEDSLPDAWGRRILNQRFSLTKARQREPFYLELMGASSLGALSYIGTLEQPKRIPPIEIGELKPLLNAVTMIEQSQGMVNMSAEMAAFMRMLFLSGSSPGGARPKALVSHDNQHWIAKFPSIKDNIDMVRIEAATLALAKDAGLDIPKFHVYAQDTMAILLVKLFDRTSQGGRIHMLSMKTLLGGKDAFSAQYQDMADVVKQHSGEPEKDIVGLFRWMCFNLMIGNTDDHLKNFMMLHHTKWRLSPAYDLLPDIHNAFQHTLSFDSQGTFPPNLDTLHASFGISANKAKQIMRDTLASVSNWQLRFDQYGVKLCEQARLKDNITERLSWFKRFTQPNR